MSRSSRSAIWLPAILVFAVASPGAGQTMSGEPVPIQEETARQRTEETATVEDAEASWSELFAELLFEIEAVRPQVETFEASEGRAELKQSMKLQNDLRSLYSKYRRLDNRLDEASEKEQAEFEEVRQLFEGTESQIAET